MDRLDLDTEKPSDEEIARKFGLEECYATGEMNCWNKVQPKIWALFDEPYSSTAAKVTVKSSATVEICAFIKSSSKYGFLHPKYGLV